MLFDSYIPQLTQTAYQKGVSCADAIFACKKIIAKLTKEGDHVYSCLYDLASAFDTVEYPVLLSHLMDAGITGKTWRLIKPWYTNPKSSICVTMLSPPLFMSIVVFTKAQFFLQSFFYL